MLRVFVKELIQFGLSEFCFI